MDLQNINPKIIWTCLILISIGAIIFCSYLITTEILEAKRECQNINGKYELKFLSGHLCDGRKFIKYRTCQSIKYNQMICNSIWIFEDLYKEEKILRGSGEVINITEVIKKFEDTIK